MRLKRAGVSWVFPVSACQPASEHQGKGFMGCDYNIDEVFFTMNGVRHDLWRAVDQDGHILDILVQRRRDKAPAKKFFRKLLKGCRYVPRVIVTD